MRNAYCVDLGSTRASAAPTTTEGSDVLSTSSTLVQSIIHALATQGVGKIGPKINGYGVRLVSNYIETIDSGISRPVEDGVREFVNNLFSNAELSDPNNVLPGLPKFSMCTG